MSPRGGFRPRLSYEVAGGTSATGRRAKLANDVNASDIIARAQNRTQFACLISRLPAKHAHILSHKIGENATEFGAI
jgi:hypothetical protein